jgi:hypothetical protein
LDWPLSAPHTERQAGDSKVFYWAVVLDAYSRRIVAGL